MPLKNNNDHSQKLKKALKTLSNKNKIDVEKLYYINNLEPNPLNSKTNEFSDLTILNYEELSEASNKKIDAQLIALGIIFKKKKY